MTRKKTDFFGIHRSNADVVSCFEPVSEFHAHRTRDLGSIRFPMIAARWLFFVPGTPRARCRPHTALHRGGREGRPRRFARVRVDRVAPTMPTATPARRARAARARPPITRSTVGNAPSTPDRLGRPVARRGGFGAEPDVARAPRALVRVPTSRGPGGPPCPPVAASPSLAPTDERDDDQADVGYPSEALGIRAGTPLGEPSRRARVARAPRAGGCGYTRGTTPRVRRPRRRARGRLSPRRQTRIPTSVEPALGLLNASSNANAAARVRTDDGSVGTLGTLSTISTRGSHPSSPDAAACRARRIEDDFEHMRERYRRPPRDGGGGDRRGESRGRRVRSRRTIRKRAREGDIP